MNGEINWLDEHINNVCDNTSRNIDQDVETQQIPDEEKNIMSKLRMREKYNRAVDRIGELLYQRYSKEKLNNAMIAWNKQDEPLLPESYVKAAIDKYYEWYLQLVQSLPQRDSYESAVRDWRENAWKEFLAFLAQAGIDAEELVIAIDKALLSPDEARDLRTILGGYYLLAEGKALDHIIDDVYNVIIARLESFVVDEVQWEEKFMEEMQIEEFGPSINTKELCKLWAMFVENSSSRVNKALAIDAVMHGIHENGLLLANLFDVRSAELSKLVIKIMDKLAM